MVVAAANTSQVNVGFQQTNQSVQPSRESKPPRAFTGIALLFIFFLFNNI